MEAQTGMEDIGGSNTVGSQTASPTQLPTYIVSYWPTTDSPTEMEKGKSKKSPDQESDHKKNQDNGKTKGNEHTETTKDNQTKDVSVPLSESSWAPRQPYTSGRAPATSISRPSLTNNSTIAKSMSSMVPSDSLSALPSQLPTEKATSALSERPSQEPTGEKSGLEYNTTANTESTLSNETEHTEEKISDKTAKMSSGSKVSFSGVFPSSKIIDNSSDISISGKGKVSLSGARDAESKASSKIYISGVFPSSQNKNDAPSITIKGNGKVSFSRTKDDDSVTPVPTPTPTVTLSSGSNQRPTSSKISISGIFPSSKNKSNPSLSIGTNGRVSFGNNIEDDAENDASLVPTLTPMVSRPNNKTKPKSDGEKVKISWSIPSSHGKKKEENATSSTANILGLKPIQYYTDVPTSPAPSSAPEDGTGKEKRQEKKKKKNKSPSPTVITLTDEPTYFVYPTLSPSNVDSNDKNISANYPTYSPTYMPTKHAKERPSRPTFAFESASGRENNDIIIDSVTPQHSDTFNNTVSKNDNTAIEPANNTSGDRESDESEEEEDRKEHSTYLYQKRICPGFPLGVNPAVPKVEQEIFFTYGIETRGTSDFSLTQVVEELQIRILDDAAINILRCNDRRLWRRGRSIQSASPVSRVYYSRSTSISTLSECTPSTAKSTHCAVVESTIYVSVIKGWQDKARSEVLSLINHTLEKGYYENSSIEFIHYLGPDLGQLSAYQQQENPSNTTLSNVRSESISYLFFTAIATILIVVCTLVVAGVMLFMNHKKRKVPETYQSFRNNSTEGQEVCGSGAHAPHSPYSSPLSFCGVTTPHSKSKTHDTTDLSDSRSLLGTGRV